MSIWTSRSVVVLLALAMAGVSVGVGVATFFVDGDTTRQAAGPSSTPLGQPAAATAEPHGLQRWSELLPAPPGDVIRLAYGPGQEINLEAGIFFMDTTTGVVEAWTITEVSICTQLSSSGDRCLQRVQPDRPRLLYTVSSDNRFVAVVPAYLQQRYECSGYLIDRRSAAAYTWNCHEQRLISIWPSHLLFEELTSHPAQRLGGPYVELTGTGQLTLLNASLASVPLSDTPPASGIQRAPEVGSCVVPPGYSARVWVSPDQSQVACQGAMRSASFWTCCELTPPLAWPTVVIADATSGVPRFRIRGASLCDGVWLADSSGVVVTTKTAYYIVNAKDGTLKHLVPNQQLGRNPTPAPDDANLFAIGRLELLDLSGRARPSASLPPLPTSSGPIRFGPLEPWGGSSKELRFTTPFPYFHGGVLCGGVGVSGSLQVEFPPFEDSLRLVVVGTGSCLNLRPLPALDAGVIECLADGRPVTVTETTLEPGNYAPKATPTGSVFYEFQPPCCDSWRPWVHVRTAAGAEGWVSGDYLDWAP